MWKILLHYYEKSRLANTTSAFLIMRPLCIIACDSSDLIGLETKKYSKV